MDWIWFVLIICIIVLAVKIVEKTNADLKLHFDNVTSTLLKQHNDSLTLNTERNTPIVSLKKQRISGDTQTQLNSILSTLENQRELISRLQTQLELKSSNLNAHVETKLSTLQTKLQNQISNYKALMETKISGLEHTMDNKRSDVDDQIAIIRCTSEDEIKTQICTLQTQLQLNNSTTQYQLDSKISALKKKIDIECSELVVKVETIRSAAHDYMENKMSNLETKQNDLNNETFDFQTQLETLRSSQDHVDGKMSTLETKHNDMDNETSNLETKLETIQSTQDHMEGKMSTLETKHNDLDRKTSNFDTQLETIRSSQDHLEGKMTTFGTNQNYLDNETSDLQQKLETIRSIQGHLEGNVSTLETKQNHLDNETSDLRTELEIIRSISLNQMETKISTFKNSMETTTSDLQQQIADAHTVVAFSAHVNQDLEGLTEGQIVQFQEVITNIKEAYNPDTGVFICPISGLYYFSVTIISFPGIRVNTALCVSGELKILTSSEGIAYNSGSATGVFHQKAGDNVCVTIHEENDVNMNCDFSAFSGHLIRKI